MCDYSSRIELLLSGQMPLEEVEKFYLHLERCRDCGLTLDRLLAADTLLGSLRIETAKTRNPEPDVVGPLLKRIQRLGSTRSAGASMPSAAEDTLGDVLAPPQRRDEIGRLGSYRVLEVLGAGGMGAVYKAEDPHLKRPVAIKVMLPSLAGDSAARQRFLREAQAAAALKHDHVVSIYQVAKFRDSPFLAMEFLEGESLEDRLRREAPLPVEEIVRLGRQITDGLAAAHARRLLHRDIKPGNIWLERRQAPGADGESPRVKILDFGLARPLRDQAPLTQAGAVVGTPAYMSPEQADGKELDPRSDLFSLGCVLYRMATGQPAFEGDDVISVLGAVANDTPAPPHKLNREIPPALSALVMKLLAKNPKDRPASAAAVMRELEKIDKTLPGRGDRRPPHSLLVDRRILIAAGVLIVLLIFALLFAGTALLYATNRGVLFVQVDDPDIDVLIRRDQLVVVDKTKKRRFVLNTGDWDVDLYDHDVKLATKNASVTRGGETKLPVPEQELAEARKQIEDEKGWVPLFNGKDLSGWKTALPQFWAVEEGVLVGRVPAKGGYANLISQRGQYEDFHLRTEVKINKAGDSGLNFRAGVSHGYQAQIYAGIEGSLLKYRTPTSQPIQAVKQTLGPPDTWYRLEVICQGEHIVVKIDGKPVVDCRDATYARGHLELEANLPGTVVHFRKVEIKELVPDTHRRAAEWVLSLGGSIRIEGREEPIKSVKELPAIAFQLRHVSFDGRENPKNKTASNLDAGLANLNGITSLTGLYMGYTQVSDAGLDNVDLKALVNLQGASFYETRISDAGLAHLKNLQNLESLYLGGNAKITDAGLAHLNKLKKLRLLRLQWTGVTDAGLVHIKGLTNLRELSLNHLQKLTDAGLAHLAGLRKLETLQLSENRSLTGPGLLHLASLSELKELSLEGTRVSTGLAGLRGLTKLENLDLRYIPVKPAELANLSGLTNLKHLSLNLTGLGDAGMAHLQNLTNLESLDVNGSGVTDKGMVHLRRLTKLKYLMLFNDPIGDAGLAHLSGMKEMLFLSLWGTQVTDAGLAHLKALSNLKGLDLRGTRVTDAGLPNLSGLTTLENLVLQGTKMTAAGVAQLQKALPKCKIAK